jgi:hypothetical protein
MEEPNQQKITEIPGRNRLPDIKKYLEIDGEALTTAEFTEFWNSCTDEEREEFRTTPLK